MEGEEYKSICRQCVEVTTHIEGVCQKCKSNQGVKEEEKYVLTKGMIMTLHSHSYIAGKHDEDLDLDKWIKKLNIPKVSPFLAEKEKEIASLRRMINILKNIQPSQSPQQEKVKGIDWDSVYKNIGTELESSEELRSFQGTSGCMRERLAFRSGARTCLRILKQTYPTGIPSQQRGDIKQAIKSFVKEVQKEFPETNFEYLNFSADRFIANIQPTPLLESKEAVEFAEWINRNGYESTPLFPIEDNGKWSDNDGETTKTTSQLYDIWKKEQ